MGTWNLNEKQKAATEITRLFQQREKNRYGSEYDALENEEFEEVKKRTIIDLTHEKEIRDKEGNLLRSRIGTDFLLEQEIPDTVNPYLWYNSIHNYFSGIVEIVKNNYYEAVGLAGASVNYIRSDHGWIIIDTGSSVEGLEYITKKLEQYLGEEIHGKIQAVVYSHTHLDHYGGTAALVNEQDDIPVYAPAGWNDSLIADHFGAGNAMERRMEYQIGMRLKRGIKDSMSYACDWDALGGTNSYVPPTHELDHNQILTIDGVRLSIYLTPDTETKAHLAVYVENYHVLYLGDNALDTLHNIQNIRGIPVRNASVWGDDLFDIATQYGDKTVAVISGHGRPHFNTEKRPDQVQEVLLNIAAAYKYIHNQALHEVNKGITIEELATEFRVPEELERQWYIRPNYGNYSFNARGTAAKYSGFFDGNPVHLKPLPSAEIGRKLIEYLGSEDLLLELAKKDFERGQYQWVAEITNHLVFANPDNKEARYLCADALEQLGYQQENGTWRNSYLMGAKELRNTEKKTDNPLNNGGFSTRAILSNLSIRQLLDHIGIVLDGVKAGKEDIEFILQVDGEKHLVRYYKGALLHQEITDRVNTWNVPVVRTSRKGLMLLDQADASAVDEFEGAGKAQIEQLVQYLTDFSAYRDFNIVEP